MSTKIKFLVIYIKHYMSTKYKSLESGLNISIKENDLKEIMYELGWISNPRSVKKLLAKCIREGYGTTKDSIDRFGNPITVDRFTMKGREKILKYFQN